LLCYAVAMIPVVVVDVLAVVSDVVVVWPDLFWREV